MLQPAFWALRAAPVQRLDDAARQHMHKLAGMYGKAGVILNGRSLSPLVDAHALETEWDRFHSIMVSWGARSGGQQPITTAQAWQEVRCCLNALYSSASCFPPQPPCTATPFQLHFPICCHELPARQALISRFHLPVSDWSRRFQWSSGFHSS